MGELKRLEALLEAAEKATARPWKLLGWRSAVSLAHDGEDLSGVMKTEDGIYAAEAVNAAEDMARLLERSHDLLEEMAEDHEHDDVCEDEEVNGCPSRLIAEIEARFGGEEGE